MRRYITAVTLLLFAACTQTHPVGWCRCEPMVPRVVENAQFQRLKPTCDKLLSRVAFNCDLRHYNPELTSAIIAGLCVAFYIFAIIRMFLTYRRFAPRLAVALLAGAYTRPLLSST